MIVKAMQHSFSWFGVAEEMFSDNGPYFTSAKYIQFTAAWDFKKQHHRYTHNQMD